MNNTNLDKHGRGKSMTTKEIFLIIIVSLILVSILVYIFNIFDFTFGLQELIDSRDKAIVECHNLGGIVVYNNDIFQSIKCRGIDSEGFAFYYIHDESGGIYKVRA